MKVLGGKSQPELQNLKQYIKVGLTTQHPKYWSLFYKLSKSPCMNIFCHDFFAHALYQTHHGPGKAKPVFAEYTTFAKKGPPNLVWCHVLPCPGISCTNVPNRVFFIRILILSNCSSNTHNTRVQLLKRLEEEMMKEAFSFLTQVFTVNKDFYSEGGIKY